MPKPTYTPGPWEVLGESGIAGHCVEVGTTSDPGPIAHVEMWDGDPDNSDEAETAKINARLVAASPEMYVVLLEFMLDLERVGIQHTLAKWPELVATYENALKATKGVRINV